MSGVTADTVREEVASLYADTLATSIMLEASSFPDRLSAAIDMVDELLDELDEEAGVDQTNERDAAVCEAVGDFALQTEVRALVERLDNALNGYGAFSRDPERPWIRCPECRQITGPTLPEAEG